MKKIEKRIIIALENYREEDSITKVAEKYKIDRHTLSKYLKYNLENIFYSQFYDSYILFDEKEITAIKDFKNNHRTFSYIKNKYGYKNEIFKNKLKALDIDCERNYKNNFNRNAFNEINSEEDAYFLGFITADGYINEKRGFLSIKLNSRDEDILQKMLNYMEADFEINHKYHAVTHNLLSQIVFNSKKLTNTLSEKYNIHQNKSVKEIPYYSIKKELIKHYIRGYIDGDGYIKKRKTDIGCCGSEEVLNFILNNLTNILNLKFEIPKEVKYDESSHIYRLYFTGDNARKIINYLYKDANIYLERKFNLAKRFF